MKALDLPQKCKKSVEMRHCGIKPHINVVKDLGALTALIISNLTKKLPLISMVVRKVQ